MIGLNCIKRTIAGGFLAVKKNVKTNLPVIRFWMGRGFKWMRAFPQYIQNDVRVAWTVVLISNAIFYFCIHSFANLLEKRLRTKLNGFKNVEQQFSHILMNSLIVGGSVFTFNILLAKILRHRLNKIYFAVITVSAIAIRFFLKEISKRF